MRSLLRHVDDVVGDHGIINNRIIGFTETQIKPLDSTCKITETLNLINIENKFLSLAYGCRNDVAVLDKFHANGVSILIFKKLPFSDRVFTLIFIFKDFFRCCNIYEQQIS